MSIAIKIRMQPHIILNESISCRMSVENKTPKTDSNDKKSDAIAEFTYFKHTFCITKQISVSKHVICHIREFAMLGYIPNHNHWKEAIEQEIPKESNISTRILIHTIIKS